VEKMIGNLILFILYIIKPCKASDFSSFKSFHQVTKAREPLYLGLCSVCPTDGTGHFTKYLVANLESESKYFETKGKLALLKSTGRSPNRKRKTMIQTDGAE